MAKYIDADKLRAEIEIIRHSLEHRDVRFDQIKQIQTDTMSEFCKMMKETIDSLQQEQPEDIVVIAKIFLDALSKTPYNNMPITDAQIIVRQLLLFFENPKEYNPDAILEQPEVDLEKAALDFGKEIGVPVSNTFMQIARHFYELGLKAEEKSK